MGNIAFNRSRQHMMRRESLGTFTLLYVTGSTGLDTTLM